MSLQYIGTVQLFTGLLFFYRTLLCWCNCVGYIVTLECVLMECVGAVHLCRGLWCVCVTIMCFCLTVEYPVNVVWELM